VYVVQDLLVYAPVCLVFLDAVVPLFVRYKIKEQLDAACTHPIAFTHMIPPGRSNTRHTCRGSLIRP
jgi:hypothetical protein